MITVSVWVDPKDLPRIEQEAITVLAQSAGRYRVQLNLPTTWVVDIEKTDEEYIPHIFIKNPIIKEDKK